MKILPEKKLATFKPASCYISKGSSRLDPYFYENFTIPLCSTKLVFEGSFINYVTLK